MFSYRYGNVGNVKIVTLAPELDGAIEAIEGLTKEDVVVSMGHTCAALSEGERGYDAGAHLITHLFNAMPSFHHRDPGLVGLLGTTTRQPYWGIIADGIHCHPSSVKIAYKAHPKGAVLVTDAMCAMGLGEGRHKLGAMEVNITGTEAYLVGTNTLASNSPPS